MLLGINVAIISSKIGVKIYEKTTICSSFIKFRWNRNSTNNLIRRISKKRIWNHISVREKRRYIFRKIKSQNKLIEYKPSNNKIVPLRKFINLCKQIKFKLKYQNKFDFSASYATYSLSSGFVSRTASQNSALWVHVDYLTKNENDEVKTKNYYKQLKCEEFKKIIFVSKESKENFLKLFPHCKEKAIYCNNLIDGQKILEKSKEEIPEKRQEIVTFLNIGRHDEKQKRLPKLIEVAEQLKKDGLIFKILFVGEGQDTSMYKQMVENKKLEDTITFVGQKKNPYPYYNISDSVILTSDYEGYPVVFLESMLLKKPIITTNVSDYEAIEGKYGIVTSKEVSSIYNAMKNFIENGYTIKEQFDYKKYNGEIIQNLEKLF